MKPQVGVEHAEELPCRSWPRPSSFIGRGTRRLTMRPIVPQSMCHNDTTVVVRAVQIVTLGLKMRRRTVSPLARGRSSPPQSAPIFSRAAMNTGIPLMFVADEIMVHFPVSGSG